MSSFVDNVDSKVSSDESKSSENLGRVKSLAELAASNLATVAADQIKESESLHDGTEIREAVKRNQSTCIPSKCWSGSFTPDIRALQVVRWRP